MTDNPHYPWYDQDGITIYHADCRDLELAADVLVTDPPYGVAFAGKATKWTAPAGGYTTPDSAIGPEVVAKMLPTVKRAAVLPGIRQMFHYPEPADIGCVYCPSGAGIGRWGFVCFHPILFYGPPPKRVGSRPASIESFDTSDIAGHPCPKPLRWMRWLVELASDRDDVILDPFMGSGTTLVAAKSAGRRAIGVDIDERYCEIAARRLAQGVLDLV